MSLQFSNDGINILLDFVLTVKWKAHESNKKTLTKITSVFEQGTKCLKCWNFIFFLCLSTRSQVQLPEQSYWWCLKSIFQQLQCFWLSNKSVWPKMLPFSPGIESFLSPAVCQQQHWPHPHNNIREIYWIMHIIMKANFPHGHQLGSNSLCGHQQHTVVCSQELEAEGRAELR